ncbi:hypothetical protein HDU67_004568 [Dinochytrium kinnereticum]|nr:hypothetical protein HDU67_004568 [Dinochytrium kinnereticum]
MAVSPTPQTGNVDWGIMAVVNGVVYLSLFIFAQGFLALGVFDAAWNKNSMQVLAGMLFNIAIFAYSIIQIDQITQYRTCSQTFLNVWSTTDLLLTYDGRTYSLTSSSSSSSSHPSFGLETHCPWNLLSSNLTEGGGWNASSVGFWRVVGDGNVEGKLVDGLGFLDRAWPVQVAVQGASVMKRSK